MSARWGQLFTMENRGGGGGGLTSAIVRAMASLSSMALFISASPWSLLNRLKSSHCWSVVELQAAGNSKSTASVGRKGEGVKRPSYPLGTRVGLIFREMFGDLRLRERQPLSMSSVSILPRWSELSCCRASCRRLGGGRDWISEPSLQGSPGTQSPTLVLKGQGGMGKPR